MLFLVITDNFLKYLIVLIIALLHEAGHLLVARFLGYSVKGVKIKPFGVNLEINDSITNNLHITIVCLAGPITNVILIVAGTVMVKLGAKVGGIFFYSNFYMLFVNLLPVLPLDGGRILKALLFSDINNKRAERVFEVISHICIFIIFICGVIFAFRREHNFSLLIISLFLLDNVKPRNKQREVAAIFFSEIRSGETKVYYIGENVLLKEVLKIVDFDDIKIIFILDNNGMVIGNITNKYVLKLIGDGYGNNRISSILKLD